MDINVTLLIQAFVFGIFIWFTLKFVWPPLTNIMEERRTRIADGLEAAEQGRKELELAQVKVQEQLTQAKHDASEILEQANQRANHIIEESKQKAREEGDRLLKLAKSEIEQEYNRARDQLVHEVSEMAVQGAEKILNRELHVRNDNGMQGEMAGRV